MVPLADRDCPSSQIPGPAAWRTAVVRAIGRLPAPLREAVWRARRARARRLRRGLEASGDWSHSSPGLDDLDNRLAEYLDFDGGFFVEAGANDGFDQSNTYLLERRRGWRGVLVEPVPELFREAVRERPGSRVFNAALVAGDYEGESVTLVYGGLMTTVIGARDTSESDHEWVRAAHEVVQERPEHEFTVAARTLSSLLDEAGAPEVDFMSLDVEGFEAQVLAGLDLRRHAPRFVLIEIREGATSRAAIDAALGARYRALEQLTPTDVLFGRDDV